MYTREQASQIKQAFWTSFGKYMAPVLSAEGEKINWINYKTGIRNLSFKMNASSKDAAIAIEITHKDPDYAQKLYDQFLLLQQMLAKELGEKWQWEQNVENESQQPVSRISSTLKDCNIFKDSDWPAVISFLKPRIISLDKFWSDHKMIFEMIG
ncbi:MAG TPA: DUF4268 domain-containing protein [Ferruginibacter sp.]|nr:DUF4268 domain-containing protein [Ferruginibacter sp.]